MMLRKLLTYTAALLTLGLAACSLSLQADTPEATAPNYTGTPTSEEPSPTTSEPVAATPVQPETPPFSDAPDVAFITGAELQIAESYPVQVFLHVWGSKPTPCHVLHYEVEGPDADNRIDVELTSEADPKLVCIQVLARYDETIPIPMEGAEAGIYSVWLNGVFVGEFSYPA